MLQPPSGVITGEGVVGSGVGCGVGGDVGCTGAGVGGGVGISDGGKTGSTGNFGLINDRPLLPLLPLIPRRGAGAKMKPGS